MEDRFNTIAGWALFGGIIALGMGSLSSHYFMADKFERPEKMGYAIEGVEEEAGEGAATVTPIANRLASGDVAKGQSLFAKCAACHTIEQGAANGIGPNLYATVGAAMAAKAGFAYSDSLKGVGGPWSFDQLDKWLANPKAFAAGTKMSFAGLANPQDRADVILYLNSKGSNVALPAPEAAPAADAEAPAADASGAAADASAAPAAEASGEAKTEG